MGEWKEYKFSDFVNISPTVILKSGIDYSFIEMKDLQDGNKYCSPSAKRKLSGGARFREGDTLFARITPCLENGKICKVKGLENGVGFGSTEFLVFCGKENISDNDFVFYLSRWDEVRGFAESNFEGTSGRQRVPKNCFDNLHLDLPLVPEQLTVASILSSLDDKIDLLHRQNKTIEALAETIFRQWFVEEANESWEEEIGNLPIEIVDGDRGSNYPKSSDFSTSGYCLFLSAQNVTLSGFNFNNPFFITKEKDDILRSGKLMRNDIVLTTRGTVGNIAFYHNHIPYDNIRINSGMVLLRVNNQALPALYLYILMKTKLFSQSILEHASGSAQPQLPIRDIKKIKIINPQEVVLKNFIEKVEPMYNKIFMIEFQIRTLTQLRDTLLPKLMSGEIRLNCDSSD